MDSGRLLDGTTLESHQKAAANVRNFFLSFLVVDTWVFSTYAWKCWTADSVQTLVQLSEACVTFFFGCDICLAVAAVWFLRKPPADDQWWVCHHNVLTANYISNMFSLAALAVCRLLQMDGSAIALASAVAFIALRAYKLRPLAHLHKHVVLMHDHPADHSSRDELVSRWTAKPDDAALKLMTRAMGISLAVVVITLGGAACWDAMSTSSPNNSSLLANTTDNNTSPLFPTTLSSLPGSTNTAGDSTPSLTISPAMLTKWCTCDSVLNDAVDGGTAGGFSGAAGGLGWCWELGPTAAGACATTAGTIGGAVGVVGGAICHFRTC